MPARDWGTHDVRALLENAGRLPREEICKALKRSEESVTQQAKRLRRAGYDISLRYVEPARSMTCPSCGRRTYTAWSSGICRPCQLRRRLTATEAETSRLLGLLPQDERVAYAATETQRTSQERARPKARRRRNASPSQERRDREDHERALEQWEAERLHRELRAAQRRKERIAAKVRKAAEES